MYSGNPVLWTRDTLEKRPSMISLYYLYYDIADTLFGPKRIYACLCTIRQNPEMWKPPYFIMQSQSQHYLNCTKFPR